MTLGINPLSRLSVFSPLKAAYQVRSGVRPRPLQPLGQQVAVLKKRLGEERVGIPIIAHEVRTVPKTVMAWLMGAETRYRRSLASSLPELTDVVKQGGELKRFVIVHGISSHDSARAGLTEDVSGTRLPKIDGRWPLTPIWKPVRES